jgi:uncharacterized protein
MSKDNVEIVQRVFAAWGRGEIGPALSAMDDSIEWRMAEDEPDARTLHGRDEVRAMVEGWATEFEEFSGTPREFLDAGEHVVVPLLFVATPRGSNAQVALEETQVYTLRAGSVIRVREYRTKAEALAAAGLAD